MDNIIQLTPFAIHQLLLRSMVLYLEHTGHSGICADLGTYRRPMQLEGTEQNHVPDITARTPGRGVPLIFDLVSSGYREPLVNASRWCLFNSAANLWNGEFHVVGVDWFGPTNFQDQLKKSFRGLTYQPKKIWALPL